MNASQRHYSNEGIKTQAAYSSNLWLSLNTFAGTELLKALKSHSFILDLWWYLLQELKRGRIGQMENAEFICMAPLRPRGRVQRSIGSTGPPLDTHLPRLFPTMDWAHSSAVPQHPVLKARRTPFTLVSLAPNTVPDSETHTMAGHTWHISSELIVPGLWP